MNQRPWWDPNEFAARKPNLDARMAVIGAIRRFFAERGFAEVETPALQVSPGLEPHLVAFETELHEPFRDGGSASFAILRGSSAKAIRCSFQ